MRLLQARIGGFGRLSGTVEFGEHLTVVAGPNEAGKTTLVECILRLLFGYPEAQPNKERERHRPWDAAQPYSATLKYQRDDGTQIETWRDFARGDVPTKTVRSDVQRPLPQYSGNHKTAPGRDITGLSLEAFQAAAVIRASDFTNGTNGAGYPALAERLAEIVGSAGKQSAAAALQRLREFKRDIGGRPNAIKSRLTQAVKESEQAKEALDKYNADFTRLRDALELRARSEAETAAAAERLAVLQRERSAAQLAQLEQKIAAARQAQRRLDTAEAERAQIPTAERSLLERAPAVEAAAHEWSFACKSEQDAREQAQSQEDKRKEIQAKIDACAQSRKTAQDRVQRLYAERAALEASLQTAAPISAETLAQINAQAEHVDALEGQSRRQATDAAVARHKPRPSPMAAMFVAVVSVLVTAAGLFMRQPALLYGGLGGCAMGVVLLTAWLHASKKRNSDQAARERSAQEAQALFEEAKRSLGMRCRQLGCEDLEAVRTARQAHVKLAQLQADAAASDQDAAHHCAQEETWQRLFEQLQGYEQRYFEARKKAERQAETLGSLLEHPAIGGGSLTERLAAFRKLAGGSERAATADARVAEARAQLKAELAGATLETLCAKRDKLRSELAQTQAADYDPPRGALPEEASSAAQAEKLNLRLADLHAAVEQVKKALDEAQKRIEHCNGRLDDFERRYPGGSGALEERLAASEAERQRLTRAKAAAELAIEVIEEVKEKVHGNFAPLLTEAISRSVRDITAGRYSGAFVDPSTFAVHVHVPETGAPTGAEQLSSGTREQLFLALRAATARTLAAGERVPLLLDDALAHSDDARLSATLAHLSSAAQDGQQVVLFTQRGAVVDAARRLHGVQVVTLPGPS